jgi:pyruvate ferredoxin oxidoreductase gamma subunit
VFSVRIHGRGGQGVVTAAELLSLAAFSGGSFAQAFPSFGSERMGAPVAAFCRIDERPIRLREPVDEPDAIIVQDATLVHQVALFEGLTEYGYVLIGSARSPAQLGISELGEGGKRRLQSVPARELAITHLGRPIPNVALLGAFAAQTGVIDLGSLEEAIAERFSGPPAEGNRAAAAAAFEWVGERTGGAATPALQSTGAQRELER